MRRRLLVMAALGAASCQSTKRVETELDVKGRVDRQEIGIDGRKKIMIQKEVRADDELRAQIWANNAFEEELLHERYGFEDCRSYLADPRLGGDSEVRDLPEHSEFEGPKKDEEIGLDENDEVKIVHRELYEDRLKRERGRGKQLKHLLSLVKKHSKRCQQRLRLARINLGLPAAKYQAKGHIAADGSWVLVRKGEKSLDDALEIRKQETK